MRDAFGGAFMIEVFLVFLMVYIVLTAVSVNYAKAFKVKDAIIDYIESNEITNIGNMDAKSEKEFENYIQNEILAKMNYNKSDLQKCSTDSVFCENGVEIIKMPRDGNTEMPHDGNTEGIYYKVNTYFGWDLSRLNIITALGGKKETNNKFLGVWKISGETRLIVRE